MHLRQLLTSSSVCCHYTLTNLWKFPLMFAENTPLTCLLYVRELLMSTASRYFFPKALGCPHPPAKNLVLGQIEQKTLLNVTFRINALYFMSFTDENKCINSTEPMYMYIYRTLFF